MRQRPGSIRLRQPLVLALVIGGFAVKLALVPAYLWLPRVAERAPALLVGVIVAVVDVTAFAQLVTLRHGEAWLFAPAWPWLALALGSRPLVAPDSRSARTT